MIITNKQKEFIKNASHRYNLKIGARRCGKTYLDILYTIPARILEGKGKEGLNIYKFSKCYNTIWRDSILSRS